MTATAPREEPPETGPADLVRLVATLAAELVRRGRNASMRRAFRAWSERTAGRLGNRTFIITLGSKRILLVGDATLSRCILRARPDATLGAGELKRRAMSLLAPTALTVSDGMDWDRRRAFNEFVLQPDTTHSLARQFGARVREAFRTPVTDVPSLQDAMRRAMLAVVFGPGVAPAQLATDVEYLYALTQQPLRQRLFGAFTGTRRQRMTRTLQRLWQETDTPTASLLAMARERRDVLGEAEALDQFPHWMFTFTGSATTLLTNTLWLILSDDGIRRRLIDEVRATGDDAAATDAWPLLTACLVESGQLFPPVTRTFHRTTGVVVSGTALPANAEIVTWFPLYQTADTSVRQFRPDRWMANHSVDDEPYDAFLGGARRCPGKNLTLLVCKTAIADLLTTHDLQLTNTPLHTDNLPSDLPRIPPQFSTARPRTL